MKIYCKVITKDGRVFLFECRPSDVRHYIDSLSLYNQAKKIEFEYI